MSESVYRRNPIGNFIDVLKERSGLLRKNQGIHGRSIMDRAPAYISITGTCNKCKGCLVSTMELPFNRTTWDETYKPHPTTIKPYPTLKSVTIEYGGDWGLAQKISAVVECYSMGDFKRVRDAFLLPGNYISTTFGYAGGNNRWHSLSQKSVTLTGFRVAVFSFSATSDGTWMCNFTAVSSATAIKNTDMMATVGTGNMTYIIAGSQEASKTGNVKSISELIAYDAQRNGKYSIDQLEDGHVLNQGELSNYNPGDVRINSAAIAIYSGDHLRDTLGQGIAVVSRLARSIFRMGDESKKTNNQVYVTLGYVVNRIINDQIMKNVLKGIGQRDKSDFEKLKIQFHPEYSRSKIPDDIRSGDPTTCLLLGGGKGNYENNEGGGKNFENIKAGSLSDVQANSGGLILLEKILLHRDLVLTCLSEAVKTRPAESDNTDVKDTQEQVINIADFFNNISDAVSEVTGGAIALRLVEDVEDKFKNSYLVVDQNSGGSTKIQCPVLDGIDSDGSTRTCEVQSNVGSQEFKAAMFIGNSKKGDATASVRGCEDQVEKARKEKYAEAKKQLNELLKSPGLVGRELFDEKQIDALKAVMVDFYRNRPSAKSHETIHWPGMSISATIDGTWGIIPGCAIYAKQVPDDWRDLNVYFMVTRVTHKFEGSDWTTDIEGIMSYYDNLNYIDL